MVDRGRGGVLLQADNPRLQRVEDLPLIPQCHLESRLLLVQGRVTFTTAATATTATAVAAATTIAAAATIAPLPP